MLGSRVCRFRRAMCPIPITNKETSRTRGKTPPPPSGPQWTGPGEFLVFGAPDPWAKGFSCQTSAWSLDSGNAAMPGHGHEMALEMVYVADLWCNWHCKTRPVDLVCLGAKFGRKTCENRPLRDLLDPRLLPEVRFAFCLCSGFGRGLGKPSIQRLVPASSVRPVSFRLVGRDPDVPESRVYPGPQYTRRNLTPPTPRCHRHRAG
jgi:hypothetical protein